jgi:hypothetical protein
MALLTALGSHSMPFISNFRPAAALAMVIAIGAPAAIAKGQFSQAIAAQNPGQPEAISARFEQDRAAILAMAGNYAVSFEFIETVAFVDGYALKEPDLSKAHEVVRVIEDTGTFISLQHILIVGPKERPIVVKHWRQDWQYEPDRILSFIGGNAWEWRDVADEQRSGAWSQTVYQVDDTPRYSAVSRWIHDAGLASWTPPHEWRPLPRRDMTTRDDYHAIDAQNRHVITPWGWVHEQDNAKLILDGTPKALAREIGINTYVRSDDFAVAVADAYWVATADYWAGVRAEWAGIAATHERFAITIKGEAEALYNPLLELADKVQTGAMDERSALKEARSVIASFVTPDIGSLADRLRPSSPALSAAD